MANDVLTAYGRRLMPVVLDRLAETDPDRVYAAIPKTSDVKDGYQDVTMADLARCVDFMAKWIEDKFGKSKSFETITYIGASDLRGPATFLAAIKTGYKLLLPMPANPAAINLSLMNQTGSNKLLYTTELAGVVKPLQEIAPGISSDLVPDFQTVFDSRPERYPYNKSFDEARSDPVLVLHSSGSTGPPKPITMTNGSWGAHDNDHNVQIPEGREKMDSTVFKFDQEARVYIMRPFFTLGGCLFFMNHAICNNITLVLGPSHIYAPDASLLKEIAKHQKMRGIMVIPAMLEQLLQDEEGTNLIKNLEFIACAGAPLPAEIGDKVCDVVKLFHFIGSTETFPLPELATAPRDWIYHEFNPKLRHEMKEFDAENRTYELIILADEENKDSAPLYHNLPGVTAYETKDLYTQHPEKPALYKYYGRRDDIVVMANGTKINPVPLEEHVQGHPGVKAAQVVGGGRTQTALLIEPKDFPHAAGRTAFLDSVWSKVEEGNAFINQQGYLTRDKLVCATAEKPFIRTGKGNIIRKRNQEAFKEEIDSLYTTS